MRDKGGSFEEDCDWAIVATVFPAAFIGHDKIAENLAARSRHAAQLAPRRLRALLWRHAGAGRKLYPGRPMTDVRRKKFTLALAAETAGQARSAYGRGHRATMVTLPFVQGGFLRKLAVGPR